MAENSNLVG